MDVISLEANKVIILDDSVKKRSTVDELKNLKIAYERINNSLININNGNYNIRVPKIFDFCKNTIYMERCFGKNLELMLRDKYLHAIGVNYTNEILSSLLEKKFFWKDFAPRNILIGDTEISIMDFERGIENEHAALLDYFLDSIYEEYGAFLLPVERLYKFDSITTNYDKKNILLTDIKSKRVQKILKRLGYSKTVPMEKYILAVRMIIKNEEPYTTNDDIIFPLIELEKYISNEGYDKYVDRIVGDYYERTRNI